MCFGGKIWNFNIFFDNKYKFVNQSINSFLTKPVQTKPEPMNSLPFCRKSLLRFVLFIFLITNSILSYSNVVSCDKISNDNFFEVSALLSERESSVPDIQSSIETLELDALSSPPESTTESVDTTKFDSAFENARFESTLAGENFTQLPVGISTDFGGQCQAQLIVVNAYFTTEYIMLDILAKVEWNGTYGDNPVKRTLRMGCWGAKYYYEYGFKGEAKLALLSNVDIPISKDGSTLVLNGKFDKNSGQLVYEKSTYLSFGCNGIESLAGHFVGSLILKCEGNSIIPVTRDKKDKDKFIVPGDGKGYLDVDFETTCSLDNFYFSTSLGLFTIGKTDVIFEVNNLTVDLSSTQSSPSVSDKLWEGFYVEDFNVYLPEAISKSNNGKNVRVSAGVKKLMVNKDGISGDFSASNLSELANGNLGKWPLSVSSLSFTIDQSVLNNISVGGALNLPIFKDDASINYNATIDAGTGDFSLNINSEEGTSFDLDVFMAELSLGGGSVTVTKSEGTTTVTAILTHGTIGLKGDKFKDFAIEFNNFVISNTPSLSFETISPPANGKAGMLSDFPITLTTFSFDNSKLTLGLAINLMKEKINGIVDATISCRHEEINGREKWKYDGTKINKINVDAAFNKFSIKGGVEMFDEVDKDGNSNKGFSGNLDFKMKLTETTTDSLNIKANAIFGSQVYTAGKDFRYWHIDLKASGFKIDLFTGVKLTGIGGGAAYNMSHNAGGDFEPDSAMGLFIRANTALLLAGSDESNPSQVGLEIQFNKSVGETGGGLNYIQLFGDLSLSPSVGSIPGAETLIAGYQNIAKKSSAIQEKIRGLKGSELLNLDTSFFMNRFPDNLDNAKANVKIQFMLKIDIKNEVFTGEASAFVNAGGILVGNNSRNGVGGNPDGNPDGYAGSVYIVFRKNEWFIHAGYKYYDNFPVLPPVESGNGGKGTFEPLGLKLQAGKITLGSVAGYFLVGYHIPDLPNPHDLGITGFPEDALANRVSRGENSNFEGLGLAFGAAAQFNIPEIQFLILYVKLNAYMGFDVLLRHYDSCVCPGRGSTFGLNNWYAEGQAYAGLGADIGVQVKIFGKVKRVPALYAKMALLLQAKLPNPSWFSGVLYGSYSVMGGIVSGSFNLNCTFGDECGAVDQNTSTVEAPEIKIVKSIYPDENATEPMDPFGAPYITFNYPFNEKFRFGDDMNLDGKFKLVCESVEGYYTDSPDAKLDLTQDWDGNKKLIIAFKDPGDFWKSKSDVEINVTFVLQEKIDGNWVVAVDTNKNSEAEEIRETKTIAFKVGEVTNNLQYNSIVEMYPAIDQDYLYVSESSRGFIKIRQSQETIFSSAQTVQLIFSADGENTQTVQATVSGDEINYTIPSLTRGKTYFVKVEKMNGGENKFVDMMDFTFHTSEYSTFSEKVNYVSSIVSREHCNPSQIEFSYQYAEPFGKEEIEGSRYINNNKPLVTAELDFNDGFDLGDILDYLIPGYNNNEYKLSIYSSDWDVMKFEMESRSTFPFVFTNFDEVVDEVGGQASDTYKYIFPLKLSYSVPNKNIASSGLFALTYVP